MGAHARCPRCSFPCTLALFQVHLLVLAQIRLVAPIPRTLHHREFALLRMLLRVLPGELDIAPAIPARLLHKATLRPMSRKISVCALPIAAVRRFAPALFRASFARRLTVALAIGIGGRVAVESTFGFRVCTFCGRFLLLRESPCFASAVWAPVLLISDQVAHQPSETKISNLGLVQFFLTAKASLNWARRAGSCRLRTEGER